MALPPELEQRFEVRGVLGRGGMGVVLAARDRELGRDVALKLLHSARSERAVERFRREGELTARLRHSGIVTLHSAGAAGGVPFLAYELVPGAQTLEDVFPKLSREHRLALVRDVARALGHAHKEGIVHRDLKPANVLLDPHGRVKVADFGLASAGDLERLTLTGAMVGTPGFMSPEQFRTDKGQALTPHTDVWALGILLYWCLTDRYPFEGGSLLELERQVLTARPERPTEIDPSVRPGLEAVCFKALSVSPDGRYPDGDAFADDLELAISGELPAAMPPRKLPVAPLVAGLLGVVGLGLGLWFARGEPNEVSLPPPAQDEGARATSAAAEDLDAGAQADRLLDALVSASEPSARLLAAWTLLREHPEHAGRERALTAARRLGTQHPVWREKVGGTVRGPAHGTFVHAIEGDLVTIHRGRALSWGPIPPTAQPSPWTDTTCYQLVFSALGPAFYDQNAHLRLLRGELDVPLLENALRISDLASSPGASYAVVVLGNQQSDNRALWIDLASGEQRAFPSPGPIPPWRAAVSRDGARVAILHSTPQTGTMLDAGAGVLRLYDVRSFPFRELHTERFSARLELGVFAADGRLAVGSGAGDLAIYESGQPLRTLSAPDGAPGFMRPRAHSGHVRGLAFDPRGARLYSTGKNNKGEGRGELRCWDLANGEVLWSHVDRSTLISSLTMTPDGIYLLVGNNSGHAEVYLVAPERLGD